MSVPRYLPHLIYSTALTSVSIHLLWHRKQQEEDNARISAQVSILESLVSQLQSGRPVKDEEIDRLRKLAQVHDDERTGVNPAAAGSIGWKDVIWGRKSSPSQKSSDDEWERKDLEKIRQEIEAEI
ncbi:hypothetical protein SERLA73DRAFT_190614 [Serpula lacrymans var. lacrymans S7.3]|uniref:Uncharacterized protein n=2 Tax=Serpula lacrymans var. lacrymans TaxID=341189 RepID=F8QG18_SERL3|nr:uncharacterized protein SERLADRAFT_368001 [Serpula lacrymans var. lacrymans S7.9]EGN92766.1 hypothetical protein SERLA73DRAFT_190614 [Serpula lacrymans var. lacrymans S7.3]EGO26426.1 hypothetical protein SERLADRAFT_368001 [Serpula lacrymans var. lacrymans S7.9]